MNDERKNISINHHYLSRLLGPLALAADMDIGGDVFEILDFSNEFHCELVIKNLVMPTFNRIDEETKEKIKNSLGVIISGIDVSPGLIEEKLSACGIEGENFYKFLKMMWTSLFPGSLLEEYEFGKFEISKNPITAENFVFVKKSDATIQDHISNLYVSLLEFRER